MLEILYHLKEQFNNLDDEPEREPGRMGKCGKNHGQHIHQAIPHDQPGNGHNKTAVEVIYLYERSFGAVCLSVTKFLSHQNRTTSIG